MYSKHGHFIYNGKEFSTKEEMYYVTLQNKDAYPNFRLWFHDDVFSKIDWTIEPTISLSELYKMRAQQIRDSYDYIILMFSGGADSTQVLKTFIDNKIFLDEVCTNYPVEFSNKIQFPTNISRIHPLGLLYEYYVAAEPRLKELAIKNPKTKITLMDSSETIKTKYSNDKYIVDNTEAFLTSNYYQTLRVLDQEAGLHKRQDKLPGKKIGVIYGADKPNLEIVDDNLRFVFDELGRSSPGCVPISKGFEEELFYWSRDLPLIPIKQGHIIKRALQLNHKLYNLAVQNYFLIKESNLIKTMIYPSFEKHIYQKRKSAENDNAPLAGFLGQRANMVIKEQINFINHTYASIKLNKTVRGGFIIKSRPYDLGPVIRGN
jgi:hypothetical protein